MTFNRCGKNGGFTLIELLVVIAIIGILAAVVLASLNDSRRQGQEAAALGEMRSIHTTMELLLSDTELYPHKSDRYCPPTVASGNEVDLSSNVAGLVATDGTYPNWQGPYIPDVIDPWGTPYFLDEDYRCTAGALGCGGIADSSEDTSALVSCGPDRDDTGAGGSCTYNDDNIVYVLCRN